jgi:DNA-binding IscR family transcriptional regulator
VQVSTKFTIAIHVLTATAYFSKDHKITSEMLAASVGCNPVIIRNIMGQLKKAGLIQVKRGPGGMALAKSLDDITFLDVYRAVETHGKDELFRFHNNPNPDCPVGRNIHRALDDDLLEIHCHFEEDLARHTLAEVYDNTEKAVAG